MTTTTTTNVVADSDPVHAFTIRKYDGGHGGKNVEVKYRDSNIFNMSVVPRECACCLESNACLVLHYKNRPAEYYEMERDRAEWMVSEWKKRCAERERTVTGGGAPPATVIVEAEEVIGKI